MKNLLLQLDSSRLPSVFDQIVAYDAGAEIILTYFAREVAELLHSQP